MFMLPNNKKIYNDGTHMWRDTVSSYGIYEAVIIIRNYLELKLKHEHSEEERLFCRELFSAMYEATAGIIDPRKLVYAYDFKTAHEHLEDSYYHASRKLNSSCASGIDRLINASCYKSNYYNLGLAAMRAI